MAKLTVLVCLGGLLIVAALPMIICGDSLIEKMKKEWEVRKIKKIEPNQRTEEQWKMLANSCFNKLSDRKHPMSLEKTQKLVETLIDAREHKPNLPLDLPPAWDHLLYFWQNSPYSGAVDKFNCKLDTTKNIYGLHSKAKSLRFDKIAKLLEGIFPDYFEVCKSDFKALAKTFKQDHSDTLAFIAKFAKLVDTQMRRLPADMQKPNQHSSITYDTIDRIEDGKTVVPELTSETKDFKNKFHEKCKVMWEHMQPTLEAMAYFIIPVKVDKEIKEFLDYLSVCHYANTGDYRTFDREVKNIFYEIIVQHSTEEPTLEPIGPFMV